MHRTLILALLAAGSFTIPATSQMRGIIIGPGPGAAMPFGAAHPFLPPRQFQSAIFLGEPFLYPDYTTAPVSVQPLTPQVIVLQPAPPAPTSPPAASEPLLIEWDGQKYVKLSDVGSGSVMTLQNSPQNRSNQTESAAHELAPMVLAFRDGRREEVQNYAIVGGILYAQADYWRDGYWTKKIELSALDLPLTVQENQARGVRFVLPSAPNQVVTRP